MAGLLIGLTVPLLLILGNKSFGIPLRSGMFVPPVCQRIFPFLNTTGKRNLEPVFCSRYPDWWCILAAQFLSNPNPVEVNPKLAAEMAGYGVTDYSGLIPAEIFSWIPVTDRTCGLIMMVFGGFLSRIWHPLCRWLYIRTCDHGIEQSAMAFAGSYLLFLWPADLLWPI